MGMEGVNKREKRKIGVKPRFELKKTGQLAEGGQCKGSWREELQH